MAKLPFVGGVVVTALIMGVVLRHQLVEIPMVSEVVCDSAISHAALDALTAASLRPIDAAVDCVVSTDCDQLLSSARSQVVSIRKFAQTLKPGCIRTAYEEWANFVENEAATGRGYQKENRETARLSGNIPAPPMQDH